MIPTHSSVSVSWTAAGWTAPTPSSAKSSVARHGSGGQDRRRRARRIRQSTETDYYEDGGQRVKSGTTPVLILQRNSALTRRYQCVGRCLFLLLEHVNQCPWRGGSHRIIRIVKGLLQEWNKITTPNMPEGSKRHNFRTRKRISRQAA